MGVNKPGRAAPPGENIIEDSDENGIDAIDVEQLRQMMSDPRYAALFSSQCMKTHLRKIYLNVLIYYRWKCSILTTKRVRVRNWIS